MDPSAVDNVLTPEQRQTFEDQGYLILENVLSEDHVTHLTDATDRVWDDLVQEITRDDTP